jgi:hypothetical protein
MATTSGALIAATEPVTLIDAWTSQDQLSMLTFVGGSTSKIMSWGGLIQVWFYEFAFCGLIGYRSSTYSYNGRYGYLLPRS